MTREELEKYRFDPSKSVYELLNKLEQSNGEYVIGDPTNPFTMLLEATTVTSANAAIEARSVIRRLFPSLANTPEELHVHLSDDELTNMFAVPAEAYMVFNINLLDLQKLGHRPDGANYVETTIPIGTEITAFSVTFTVLNDIVVRLYDTGSIFIEQQYNSNDLAVNDMGVIEGIVTHSTDGIPWVLFETKVKQVKITTTTETVIGGVSFNKTVPIKDKYCYANVTYSNKYTAG